MAKTVTSVDPAPAAPEPTQPFPGKTRTVMPTRACAALIIALLKWVVDKTGSMSRINTRVAQTMCAAVDQCAGMNINLRCGLTIVRDVLCEGWANGLVDLGVLDTVEFKKKVELEPCDGGGDADESQLMGMLCAARGAWPGVKPGKVKHIVVVTNSGTHVPAEDGTTLEDAIDEFHANGVRVHIIGPTDIDAYRRITSETGGFLFPIDDLSTDYFRQVMETIGKTVTATTFAN